MLIVWPSRQQVKKTLPSCFRKLYPKVRCIIDCFECFTETPSGLDLAATSGSEYKHHYTFKVLVAITPNWAISYFSPCYGGRVSDILRNSGFLNMIEPYDEVMAERGFKIREDLMMHMATLCIPPSCASSMQLLNGMLEKHPTLLMYGSMWSKPLADLKCSFFWKMNCPLSCFPWLMILFISALLCVICSHHSVFNILFVNILS